MNARRVLVVAIAALATLSFCAGAAARKTATPADLPKPAQSPAPETKTIGDWSVRCFAIQSPAPCDMFQLLTQKKTGQRVMSLSIAYMQKTDQHVIQIVLPLGVAIEKGVRISAGSYTSPPLEYRRCNRSGCFVEGIIDNAAIRAIGRSSAAAKVSVVSSEGQPLDIKYSLRGFAEAHEAMLNLTRQMLAVGASEGLKR